MQGCTTGFWDEKLKAKKWGYGFEKQANLTEIWRTETNPDRILDEIKAILCPGYNKE